MISRTGRNECVIGENSHISRARVPGQGVGLSPHAFVHGKLRQRVGEFPEHVLLVLPTRAVSRFELDYRIPAGETTVQCSLDLIPHGRSAVPAKNLNSTRRVDQDQDSAATSLRLKLFRRHQILAGPSVVGELSHAHPAIEVRYGTDNGLTFCPCVGEPDGIRKFAFGNIHGRLHGAGIGAYPG